MSLRPHPSTSGIFSSLHPFPLLCHLPAGMDCIPNLNTRSSPHLPPVSHSLSWAGSCPSPSPELWVSLLGLSHLPQASSPLLSFPPWAPPSFILDTDRDMTHSSVHLAGDLSPISPNASWHSKEERKFIGRASEKKPCSVATAKEREKGFDLQKKRRLQGGFMGQLAELIHRQDSSHLELIFLCSVAIFSLYFSLCAPGLMNHKISE